MVHKRAGFGTVSHFCAAESSEMKKPWRPRTCLSRISYCDNDKDFIFIIITLLSSYQEAMLTIHVTSVPLSADQALLQIMLAGFWLNIRRDIQNRALRGNSHKE